MEFPSQDTTVIIAMKGLPFSGTGYDGEIISRWARSPIFSLDLVLGELYKEGKYNATSRPLKEEDERLQRHAFSILCQVAMAQVELDPKVLNCVVINSSLSSTSQLDQLIGFSKRLKGGPHKLLIIECRIRHKLLWQQVTQYSIDEYESKSEYWFMPKSWNDIEKAIEEYDAKVWDQHYDHLQSSLHPHHLLLRRLVLDPEFDLGWTELSSSTSSSSGSTTINVERKRFSPFPKAIEYLLTDEAAPPVVDYRKWRKQLMEKLFILATTSTTPDNITNLCGVNAGDCNFTYTEDRLPHSADHPDTNTNININCRACEKQLIVGEGVYACVSCNLALHKSCADFPTHHLLYADLKWRPRNAFDFPTQYACNSCSSKGGGFSYECRSCIFETHLKWCKVPTVVNKPHLHPHPLSIHLTTDLYDDYVCELCSRVGRFCSYFCVRCNSAYHLRCAHSPRELAHKHQGYLHLMKLMLPTTSNYSNSDDDLQPEMFSRGLYLDQDDLWCDVCYNEIDVDAAYYSCSECPDYVAHVYCISPLWI